MCAAANPTEPLTVSPEKAHGSSLALISVIRPIQPTDNPAVEAIILNTLEEFGCVGPGYASSDPEIRQMFETYQAPHSQYWVVADAVSQQILGGAGYGRLKGTTEDEAVCELQKVYFHPASRGKGLGTHLLSVVIDDARRSDYRQMYLETVAAMKTAQHLYHKLGFVDLEHPMGNTGHWQCPIRMVKDLA